MSESQTHIISHSIDDVDQSVTQPTVSRTRDGLYAETFGDVYYRSGPGIGPGTSPGRAESEYVFLRHNRLAERFAGHCSGRAFVIGEIGFGCGRNVVSAANLFLARAPRGTRLHIVAIEKYPLSADDARYALRAIGAYGALSRRLCAQWPPAVEGVHRLPLAPRVTVDVHLADVVAALESFDGWVDAWFFDGFAPAHNPRVWRFEVMAGVAAVSRPRATFATFTSAGWVRRGLQNAGFACRRAPGFGPKRQMLHGRLAIGSSLAERALARRRRTTWFVPPSPRPSTACVVVGAGIAGASVARALAERGCSVTVVDADGPAAGASAVGRREFRARRRPMLTARGR